MSDKYQRLSQDLKICDYNSYFNYLLISNKYQRNLFLLIHLFNFELHKSLHSSQEQMICLIRLQWWRDSIEAIYNGDISKHKSPIIEELFALKISQKIDKDLFLRLISVYQDEVENKNSNDIDLIFQNFQKKYNVVFTILFEGLNLNIDNDTVNDLTTFFAFNKLISKQNSRQLFINKKQLLASICQEIGDKMQKINNISKNDRKSFKNFVLFLPITKSYIKKLAKLNYDVESFTNNSILKDQCLMLKSIIVL